MARENRPKGEADLGVAPASYERLPRELAEQVELLAGDPCEGVMWSDVFDHLRGGFNNFRRLWPERAARTGF